ncbi:MAG: nucleotide exchange factor GrpE [Bacteroidales bacterium]|nr:nucleotide exchange factor GrpE [Bacteroidales bacterium]MCR4570184.1 nucleotide exchange factor GrpE [Bacteroidales bacterium]
MAEKKKNNKPEVPENKKLAALEARIEGLNVQLEEVQKKEADAKADYLRLMAEFDTFRRRTAEEKLALVSSASADVIKGLLPILDDCEIALSALEKSADSESAKAGTEMIFGKLNAFLKGKGLERIDAKGKDFDTELHEAVTTFPAPSEDQKGKVIDVVQTGYTLGGKVLRYAKVVVGA